MNTALPDILNFLDYREFLRHVVTSARRGGSGGLRQLSLRAGFRSPSMLSMVISGKRKLSLEAATRVAEALGLSGRRRSYFLALVKLIAARTSGEKVAAQESVLELQRRSEQTRLQLHQYRFLAFWYYPAIYAMIDSVHFRRDPQWIADRLGRGVTATDVKRALGDLLNLGLLKEIDGRLVCAHVTLTTDEDVKSAALQRYHKSMIELAGEALDLSLEHREMNGVTFALSLDQIPLLKKRIRQLRSELNEMLGGKQETQQVYQLNVQLIPLTSRLDKVEAK